MKVEVEVVEYTPEGGLTTRWDDGFEIEVHADLAVVVRANPEGLRTLARDLLTLAAEPVPAGTHLHYDLGNSLAEGSPS